jgi:ComF family protein
MTLINDFMSLIYPRRCEACSEILYKHEHFICNYCSLNLPKSNFHLKGENDIGFLLAGRIPLQQACSFFLFEKSGKIQKLLHSIKYQKQKELAEFLGKKYADELALAGALSNIDVILPIPLHPNKIKQRGFNQSEWFAKGLAQGLQLQLETTYLSRAKETGTQTKKRKYARWENVEGVFFLNKPEALKNKHVLLADDVITTGATLEAVWQCLKEVEGIKVSVCALAFAAKK